MKRVLAACAAFTVVGGALLGIAGPAAADDLVPAPVVAVEETTPAPVKPVSEPVEVPAPVVEAPVAEAEPVQTVPTEAAAPVVAEAPVAPVSLAVAPEPASYVLAAWHMPSYVDADTATWPQSLVKNDVFTTKDLGAFDTWLSTQCGAFQVDGYLDDKTTAELLGGAVLYGINNPTESLWPGGWGEAYKVVNATGGCQPPVTNAVCDTYSDNGTSSNQDANGWVSYDTRTAGHDEYVNGGLHVFTDDNSSQAKVSWAKAENFPLKNTGQIGLDWTGTTPPPGVNLFVNFGADGNGTLVYESVYGQDLWLTNGSSAAVKANAPVNGGGNGSQWHGTIDQWLTAYPDATVTGIAFSLGSGVLGDGVLHSISTGCATDYFGFEKAAQPEPRVTTEQRTTTLCFDGSEGGDTDETNAYTTVYGTDTTYPVTYDAETDTWVEGEGVVGEEYIVSNTAVSSADCVITPPVITPPTTEPTPPVIPPTTDGTRPAVTTVVKDSTPPAAVSGVLASTGVDENNLQVLILIATGLLTMGGFIAGVALARRRYDRKRSV